MASSKSRSASKRVRRKFTSCRKATVRKLTMFLNVHPMQESFLFKRIRSFSSRSNSIKKGSTTPSIMQFAKVTDTASLCNASRKVCALIVSPCFSYICLFNLNFMFHVIGWTVCALLNVCKKVGKWVLENRFLFGLDNGTAYPIFKMINFHIFRH